MVIGALKLPVHCKYLEPLLELVQFYEIKCIEHYNHTIIYYLHH
jgi:hypothetical protein